MPLNPTILATMLEQHFANPPGVVAGGVFNAPATIQLAAQAWSDAVQAWAVAILPASATVAAACAALTPQLVGAFSTVSGAAPLMDAAFATFALTVGGGMVGYVPVPPVLPVNFALLFQQVPPNHTVAAQGVALQLDLWMRTGISTLAVPPNTPMPWT